MTRKNPGPNDQVVVASFEQLLLLLHNTAVFRKRLPANPASRAVTFYICNADSKLLIVRVFLFSLFLFFLLPHGLVFGVSFYDVRDYVYG